MSTHLFFCGGIHCSVMLERSNELCDLCKPKSKLDQMIELTKEINSIKEKLITKMTPGQKDDWRYLLEKKQDRLIQMQNPCAACCNQSKIQLDHMHPGGCLYNGS